MDPVVLRLPRVDHPQDEPPFVLVHVTSAGRRLLDVDLIGTDNGYGFSVSLRHQPSSLGKKNSSAVNQEDWEAILTFILLGTAPGPDRAAVTEDLEAVAKVDGNLTITVQKRVEGITQKLGTITLAEDADALEKIDLFEWCGLSVTSKNTTTKELESQQKALREKNEQVKKLEDALAELKKLKNDHENDLLEKFSLLLNEKKLKIRDQQRLLTSSNVDPARLAGVEEKRSERHHSAGPSRRGKRKAGTRVESEGDESDGFQNMDVDEAPNESEQDQPQTPPQDVSTADESSEGEAPVPPPTRKNLRESPAEASSSAAAPPPPREAVVPPRRELPVFQKKPAAKPAPVVDGSETESDDEL
ncbi:hypothetical protein F5882DRAFT_400478 [Hyaloscypha sp. PMI_1271]|nr:hypothetical protein F5882DRAFT_400478 [Hyaloscypha sp. PMI_1271]